jgi:predicted 3-demethylubiquinone-9 3-methyltransferase (glyoxalase superfamily)
MLGISPDEFPACTPSQLDDPIKEEQMPPIITNLWFDGQAEEAAEFYVSIFPNSRILSVIPYTEAGPSEPGSTMVVAFELDGTRIVGINGGPQFTFSEAISLQIECADQEEIDHYWSRLTEGGEEGPCGWLKDRFGLSWQVTPAGMDEFFDSADPEAATRAAEAMFGMKKLDLAALRAAADAVPN